MKLLTLRFGTEYFVAMGDTIDVVSLINQLSLKHRRLLLPCQSHYVSNVRSFFEPTADIEFYPLRSFNDYAELKKAHGELLIQGYNDNKAEAAGDVKSLYRAAGCDYVNRAKYCSIAKQISRIPQIEPPTEPYAFVPEGGSEKFYTVNREYIDKGLIVIVPPQDGLMLSYAKIIANANEIHCHATAYPQLIDKIPTKGKLFWHKYPRSPHFMPDFVKDWVVIYKPFNEPQMEKQTVTAPVKEKQPAPNVATVQKPKQQAKEKPKCQ